MIPPANSIIEPRFGSYAKLRDAFLSGATTCTEVVEYYLERIEATRGLNIYIEVYRHEALQKAQLLDAQLREDSDRLGKLAGCVISVKDLICYRDHLVTAGSAMLQSFESLITSTVLERLLAEDVIVIGRVNCDEFGMGSTTENSVYGPTRNGYDPALIPGGSSGGSAVSVQVDTCLASVGTDTGGSIRQPAAFCGVLGFKPTYGTLSRFGVVAYASSFDQIGFIGRDTNDLDTLLTVGRGHDNRDSTLLDTPDPGTSRTLERVGVLKSDFLAKHLDRDDSETYRAICTDVAASGREVLEIELPWYDQLIPCYYILTTAEASSNLARYDGVRYGPARDRQSGRWMEEARAQGFGLEVKRRILLGAFVLSAGYYDAFYQKAQKVRRLIRDEMRRLFSDIDLLMIPASPVKPWKIGQKFDDPTKVYLSDVFTVLASLSGCPALVLPITKNHNKLSFGIQFVTNYGADKDLFDWVTELNL